MTIMIVEDNPAMRKTIRDVAAAKTDTVIECSNGEEAVTSFAQHYPDWVLMDINMPVLDGVSATKRIMSAHPSAKIVMVTDSDNESFRIAAKKAGACGYVLKENLFELQTVLYYHS
ncbi:MAG: response regulator transcription factor [Bacteroidota bacterium]|jgi:two-component system response regulator DegU